MPVYAMYTFEHFFKTSILSTYGVVITLNREKNNIHGETVNEYLPE